MTARSGADSFGTFLETYYAEMRDRRRADDRKVPLNAALKLLIIIAKTTNQSEPPSVAELLGVSGMGFLTFSDALNALTEVGLVRLVGPPGDERVELDSSGKNVARLMG